MKKLFLSLLLTGACYAQDLNVINLRGTNAATPSAVWPVGRTELRNLPDGSAFEFDGETVTITNGATANVVLPLGASATVTYTKSPSSWFWWGLSTGLIWGGTAFTFRLARQAGRQSPEI